MVVLKQWIVTRTYIDLTEGYGEKTYGKCEMSVKPDYILYQENDDLLVSMVTELSYGALCYQHSFHISHTTLEGLPMNM